MKKKLVYFVSLCGVLSTSAYAIQIKSAECDSFLNGYITSVQTTTSCLVIKNDAGIEEKMLEASLFTNEFDKYRTFYFEPGTYKLSGDIKLKSSFYRAVSAGNTNDNMPKPYKFASAVDGDRPIIIGDTSAKRIFKTLPSINGERLTQQGFIIEGLELQLSCNVNSNPADCGILEYSPLQATIRNSIFKSQFGFCIKHNATSDKDNSHIFAYENYITENSFRCRYGYLTHHETGKTDGESKPTDNFFINNTFEVVGTEGSKTGYAFSGVQDEKIVGAGMVGSIVRDNNFLLHYNANIAKLQHDYYVSFTSNIINLLAMNLNSAGAAVAASGKQTILSVDQGASSGAVIFANNDIRKSVTGRIVTPVIEGSFNNENYLIRIFDNSGSVAIECLNKTLSTQAGLIRCPMNFNIKSTN